jgi:hypothetical protein
VLATEFLELRLMSYAEDPPSDATSGRSRNLKVLCVHGTFGRGIVFDNGHRIRWFDEGSSFTRRITELLAGRGISANFVPALVWSGANSIRARHQAAESLASRLDACATEDDGPIMVVAHSHGGNVAMKALNLVDPATLRQLRIVTLATPFLKLFEIGYADRRLRTYSRYTYVLMFLALPAVLLHTLEYAGSLGAGVFGLLLASLYLAVMMLVLGLLRFFLDAVPGLRTIDHYDLTNSRLADLVSLSNYTLDPRRRVRGLVLRGPDDEAALLLGLGSLQSKVSGLVARAFSLPFLILAFCFPAFLYVGLVSVLSGGRLFGPESRVDIVGVALVSYLGLPLLHVLSKGLFARELAYGSARCDVAVDSTPETDGGISVVTVGTGGKGLRHALYDNDAVRHALTDWITREMFSERRTTDTS